jgi:hypothetical protein
MSFKSFYDLTNDKLIKCKFTIDILDFFRNSTVSFNVRLIPSISLGIDL